MLLGYVVGKPVEKQFENRTRCVNITLKTRDLYGPPTDRKVNKNFHNLILWNSIGDQSVEILQPGDIIHVVGRLKNIKIEDYLSNRFYYRTEIVVEEWTKVLATDIESDDNEE